MHDVSNIYRVPLLLEEQGILDCLLEKLELDRQPTAILNQWRSLASLVDSLTEVVTIAIVGKYTSLGDAYLSVTKALYHASYACERKLEIAWIEATDLEVEMQNDDADKYQAAWAQLRGADGVLVPGGFGDRGVEGKILAARYARENKVPYFGICLGFQVAVIEYARNVLGWKDAHSAEFDEATKHPVRAAIELSEHRHARADGRARRDGRGRHARDARQADAAAGEPQPPLRAPQADAQLAGAEPFPVHVCLRVSRAPLPGVRPPAWQVVMYMPEISKTHLGGTMRLGTRRAILKSTKCLASRLYGGVTSIDERHRHR
jgi:CTP synthase (UTP-ammonia lyase)